MFYSMFVFQSGKWNMPSCMFFGGTCVGLVTSRCHRLSGNISSMYVLEHQQYVHVWEHQQQLYMPGNISSRYMSHRFFFCISLMQLGPSVKGRKGQDSDLLTQEKASSASMQLRDWLSWGFTHGVPPMGFHLWGSSHGVPPMGFQPWGSAYGVPPMGFHL